MRCNEIKDVYFQRFDYNFESSSVQSIYRENNMLIFVSVYNGSMLQNNKSQKIKINVVKYM